MLHDALTAGASLLMPPGLVFLFLALGIGFARIFKKKWAAFILLAALALAWVSATPALAKHLMGWHTSGLKPLGKAQLTSTPSQNNKVAIVVLGVGEVSKGLEYGQYGLRAESYERLRYGIYLSRLTNLEILYSGGQLPADAAQSEPSLFSEAAIAFRTARTDFNTTLRWVDVKSVTVRDSVKQVSAIFKSDNIQVIYLVAHAWKLPRAIQAYENAGFAVVPAPIDFPDKTDLTISDFFPTSEGTRWVRNVVRERFGMVRGQN